MRIPRPYFTNNSAHFIWQLFDLFDDYLIISIWRLFDVFDDYLEKCEHVPNFAFARLRMLPQNPGGQTCTMSEYCSSVVRGRGCDGGDSCRGRRGSKGCEETGMELCSRASARACATHTRTLVCAHARTHACTVCVCMCICLRLRMCVRARMAKLIIIRAGAEGLLRVRNWPRWGRPVLGCIRHI